MIMLDILLCMSFSLHLFTPFISSVLYSLQVFALLSKACSAAIKSGQTLDYDWVIILIISAY